MNSRLFLMAVAVIAAFGLAAAAVVGPVTIATPAVAQNVGNRNATGRNLTESLVISEQRGVYSEYESRASLCFSF